MESDCCPGSAARIIVYIIRIVDCRFENSINLLTKFRAEEEKRKEKENGEEKRVKKINIPKKWTKCL